MGLWIAVLVGQPKAETPAPPIDPTLEGDWWKRGEDPPTWNE